MRRRPLNRLFDEEPDRTPSPLWVALGFFAVWLVVLAILAGRFGWLDSHPLPDPKPSARPVVLAQPNPRIALRCIRATATAPTPSFGRLANF